MKFKILTYICCFLLLGFVGRAQQIQLYDENFESGGGRFRIDTAGPSATAGTNAWIINNQYNGQSVYPNTTSQDSTVIGTITGAPYSKYLHITDSTSVSSPGVSNCNFNPANASNKFAYMEDGFCTLGMQDVKMVFFYIAEGDTFSAANPTAYGEVYYSADGGAWTLAKNIKYSAQTKWKYEQIQNPAFDNVSNLRIGFRWVNTGSNQPKTMSFGIDDILIVGTYDNINNPITLTVAQQFPDPVCQLNNLIIQWKLSAPLCGGTYKIELSAGTGAFANPATSLGVFNIGTDTTGYIAATIPGTTPPGLCYKVRVVRLNPLPTIVGIASVCFEVQACPNTINTMTPIVTTDPDTVCSRSAIDIPFTSKGVYQNNNIYIAEMSDSNGDFTNAQFIGNIPNDPTTYDPALGVPPGNISGLVPITPEGCNYFIRVRATNPATVGSIYGPFCVKHCDLLTNQTVDISVCISDTSGVDTLSISVNINEWNTNASYADGNLFCLQLLDMMSLAVVNNCDLGAYYDTTSNTFNLIIPELATLLSYGIAPGAYYARFLADSSNTPWNANGTIIRITIGAPASAPPEIIVDTVICNAGIVPFFVVPYNPDSKYEWVGPTVSRPPSPPGTPFIVDGSQLLIDFTGSAVSEFTILVRELNFGCYGPYSDVASVDVISTPTGLISGPTEVCLGDTVQFEVPFLTATFYEWSTSYGRIVDTSNNQISIVFDSIGNVTIQNYALNDCGSNTVNYTIQVISLLEVDAGNDTLVCPGVPVDLRAATDGFDKSLQTTFTDNVSVFGCMFDIYTRGDIIVQNLEANFASAGNIDVEIWYKQGTHVGFENDATAWTLIGNTNIPTANATGSPTLIPSPLFLTIPAGTLAAFYVRTNNTTVMRVSAGTGLGNLYSSDAIVDIFEGTSVNSFTATPTSPRVWNGILNYFTFAGISYEWSNGDTTETIRVYPYQNTLYTVEVKDTTGCGNSGQVYVEVIPGPAVDAGTDDEICLGESITIFASVGGTYTWTPTTGLSDSNSLTPTIAPNSDVSYVLSVLDSITGCYGRDTVSIAVRVDNTFEDSTVYCIGEPVTLSLPETQGSVYAWSTGDSTASIQVTTNGIYTAQYFPPSAGCGSLYTFVVNDLDCDQIISVPEAFTPNNDGVNDYFTVFGKNIDKYTIQIFNRWGEIVYESSDATELNDLSRGWDGKHKGALQNIGTFVYFIQAVDANGVKIETQGNLTLIR